MTRPLIGVALVTLLWQPLQPIRVVTAQALHTAADLIAR